MGTAIHTLRAALIGLALSFSSAALAAPDVILFLADDLGPTTIGPERRAISADTPNIDAIAANGVAFTAAYAAPVCVQTRTMLMTGRWQQRNSVGAVINNGPQPPGSIVTLAERLRALGYATAAVGKWHLGFSGGRHPLDQGFDQFLGFKGITPDYVGHDPDAPLYRGRTAIQNTGNVTDTLGTEAVRILLEPRDRPLFLYLPWTAPHDPLQATLGQRLEEVDHNVGRVLAVAKPDTLVIWAGDNGRAPGTNKPFRGGKYDIWEGGVRVPLYLSWPQHIAPKTRDERPVSLIDVAITAVIAAGGSFSDTDGFDLLAQPENRPVFFRGFRNEGAAVRQGPWKLYLDYEGVATRLYHVETDKGETKNLAAGRQDIVKALRPQLQAFLTQLKD